MILHIFFFILLFQNLHDNLCLEQKAGVGLQTVEHVGRFRTWRIQHLHFTNLSKTEAPAQEAQNSPIAPDTKNWPNCSIRSPLTGRGVFSGTASSPAPGWMTTSALFKTTAQPLSACRPSSTTTTTTMEYLLDCINSKTLKKINSAFSNEGSRYSQVSQAPSER